MSEALTEAPGSVPLNKFEHEVYARERALGQPITHAAERAGLSKRSGAGSKLEADDEVRARIAWLAREDDELIREKRRRLEERLWLIHDVDPSKFYDVIEEYALDDEGEQKRDVKGNPIVRRRQVPKPFGEVPIELRPCIKTLTENDSGRANLVLYDKQDAGREIRKFLGLDAPTKLAATKGDGSDLGSDQAINELTAAMMDIAARLIPQDEPTGSESEAD